MSAYETATNEAMKGVESLCRHICGPGGFNATSKPTLAEVQRFETQAYYKIAGALVAAGYAVSQSAAAVLGFLQNLQVLETVVSVELAYPITGPGEPNERFRAFMDQLEQLYELLKAGIIDTMGGDTIAGNTAFVDVTGVSISRKDSIRQDSDFVGPRFRRGQFRYPGADPGTTRLSGETLG